MSNVIVMGSQWGDEGKGKLVDVFAKNAELVVRFQGGANAGHTIVIDGVKYVTHVLPSGIFTGKKCVIGNGVVLDYKQFVSEIAEFTSKGFNISPENLILDNGTHIIFDYQRVLDGATGGKIGTTGRGIGPAYMDKVERIGVRAEELIGALSLLEEKIRGNIEVYNKRLSLLGVHNRFDADGIVQNVLENIPLIKPYIRDSEPIILKAARAGKVLYEGAQGAMLDIDHGTYPFVTSSSTTIGGAYSGTGVFVEFDYRVGLVKAYTTRVGEGPFPTEQINEYGKKLQSHGGEVGATTGRPRRCGWLDLEIIRKAIIMNGINTIALSKLDVLDDFDEIPVCTHYDDLGKPDYTILPGWNQPTHNVKSYDELPANCRNYISFIERKLEELTGVAVPVDIVSVGPDREHTILRTEFNLRRSNELIRHVG